MRTERSVRFIGHPVAWGTGLASNRVDAKVGIEQWRRHYNEVRPHSSLGYLTPAEFKATVVATVTEGGSAATPPRPAQEDQRPDDLITLTGAVLQ